MNKTLSRNLLLFIILAPFIVTGLLLLSILDGAIFVVIVFGISYYVVIKYGNRLIKSEINAEIVR